MTDPDDDTHPHATGTPEPARPIAPSPGSAPAEPGSPTDPPPREPTLQADPDRPRDSGWREPPWFPPDGRRRRRERPSNAVAILVGLALIAIGGWYFLERTLGIDLPRIQWGSLWPVILIVLGGWILIQSVQRRS